MFVNKRITCKIAWSHQLLISDSITFVFIPSLLEPSSMLNSYSATQPHHLPSRLSSQKPWQYLLAICTQGTGLAHKQGAHQTRICISYGISSREVHPGETGRILSSGASIGRDCPAVCYFLKGLSHQARVGWAYRKRHRIHYSHWLEWVSSSPNSEVKIIIYKGILE